MTPGAPPLLSRRQLFFTAGATGGLLAMLRAAARPPNVILLVADDAGYECFAPYGSRQYSTPVLSGLARSGVRFDHCYATPLCTPTRVALMTGQNNVRNYTDFGAMPPGQYTFADLFHRAGYASAIAGKWQLQGTPNAKGVAPADAGFDTYCLWNTARTSPDRYWRPSIECDGKLISGREDQYGPDLFAKFLLDFIEENRKRPFFAYYPMALTHSPFLPTPDSKDSESKDLQNNFADMVTYCDKIVGRFLDALERLKLRDNTLFIFTADNGTEHTIVSRLGGRTIRGDKGRPTGAGTHVPLIAAGPGIPAGRVLDDLVDFTDFLPTLADAIGSRLPSGIPFDGQSFWPQLTGARNKPRETIFNYYFPRPYSKTFDSPYRHPEIRYAHNHRYKLYGDGRLFDVTADPEEKQPLPAQADTPSLEAVRGKLQAAIDRMPAHGLQIPREHWQRSQGVPSPAWH
jgi:arylsulfatase A